MNVGPPGSLESARDGEPVQLSCGELSATVVGGPLLSVSSLRFGGRELLLPASAVPSRYRVHGLRAGITLMHPWANRLGADAFTVNNRELALRPDDRRLARDDNRLAIHGITAEPGWMIEAISETACRATLGFAAMAEFPFAHEAQVVLELTSSSRLTLDTTILPSDSAGVPVAFGWHPYFPFERESGDELVMPRCSRLRLDDRGLPTGEAEPVQAGSGVLTTEWLDDLFAGIEAGSEFAWRTVDLELAVIHERGYPCGQVFAPTDVPVLSLEPMTAPTDALRTGQSLTIATVEAPVTARFAVVARHR